MKTILVDDEFNGIENLQLLLAEFCPDLEVVATAQSIDKAREALAAHSPELVFLDVQMGSQTIFELLQSLPRIDFQIIFVTAYNHFALRAIEFMALDYLLKPIEIPKLVRAVDKAREGLRQRSLDSHLRQLMLNLQTLNNDQHKIALATSDGYELVQVSSILYLLADGSYSHIHFRGGGELTVSRHLKHYERLLEGYGFMRSHQSALINLRYIQKLLRTDGGLVEMEDGRQLPISKARRQELEQAIKSNQPLL